MTRTSPEYAVAGRDRRATVGRRSGTLGTRARVDEVTASQVRLDRRQPGRSRATVGPVSCGHHWLCFVESRVRPTVIRAASHRYPLESGPTRTVALFSRDGTVSSQGRWLCFVELGRGFWLGRELFNPPRQDTLDRTLRWLCLARSRKAPKLGSFRRT